MALASPFFRTLPLAEHGLEWIHPPVPLAHPLDDGTAVVLERSIHSTAEGLGPDGAAYARLMRPLVADWGRLDTALLGPLRLPRHPVALARFGIWALRSAHNLACTVFKLERPRALFAGLAAHSMLPLEQRPSAAFALVFAIAAHAVGWPLPRGGSQRIADALLSYLRSLGGEVVSGYRCDWDDEIRVDDSKYSRAALQQVVPSAESTLKATGQPEDPVGGV